MSSAQVMDTIGRVLATIGWSLVGVLIFYAGTRLFDMLDPVDYAAEIKRGNTAAALKLAAVTLGLAAIIIAAIVA